MIGDGANDRSKYPEERTRCDHIRYRCELDAKAACKNRQKWIHHPLHGVQDGTEKHENDKLEAKAHEFSVKPYYKIIVDTAEFYLMRLK
jgi:hypothetical protein